MFEIESTKEYQEWYLSEMDKLAEERISHIIGYDRFEEPIYDTGD